MAPSWMTMSKDFAVSSCEPSRCPTRMRCPVEDTGRYSVSPSTMPRVAAPRGDIRAALTASSVEVELLRAGVWRKVTCSASPAGPDGGLPCGEALPRRGDRGTHLTSDG